jgi:hypothetical protein
MMEPVRSGQQTQAMRSKMKGALVKVLSKAKPPGGRIRRFPSARLSGGYVRLAQTGLKKMFKAEPLLVGPRLPVADPAPLIDPYLGRAEIVARALDSLAPATTRAAVHGRAVTVTVDDEDTAQVFRDALELTAVNRPTDGLIDIRVRGA